MVNTIENRTRKQLNLDKMEIWAHANKIKFNRDKCKVLSMGSKHKLYKYWIGETCLGSSTSEKHLGVLVDHKLNMSQQCGVAPHFRKNFSKLEGVQHRTMKLDTRDHVL